MIDVLLRVALLVFISMLGWGVGKKLKINSKDISSLLIYIISPFVVFYSIVESPANWMCLKYSLGAFIVASSMAMLGLVFARLFWKDGRVNLFGFAAGTGNTGYFALPLMLAVFDKAQIAIAIFIIIGINLYEFTIGYFLTAKGSMTYRESIQKVIRMTIIYAAVAGIIFKYFNIRLDDVVLSFLSNFKGAYTVLGMMVVGVAISRFSRIEIDWLFLMFALLWKHLVYPAIAFIVFVFIIPVDKEILRVIILMAATPMAGNIVVISSNLGLHPEKAATSVMISTILAIITVPLALYFITVL